tara:strand:+ start:47 stop:328 length:282 start_codon:yes stop_codon:yes gene_type:complete
MPSKKNKEKKDAALDKGTWGKEHDRKLLELFDRRTNRGKVSTEDLSKKYIESVLKKHFPGRSYKSFSPLFRKKARKYNLDKALEGERKKGKLL